MKINPEPTDSRKRRFYAKTIDVAFSGCVAWMGGTNEHGYGVFWNGARLEKAHRFALRCDGVSVPDDADVLHTCDVPCCVNPRHLTVGDAKANVADMWTKRRAAVVCRRGEAQVQSKLTDTSAEEIRRAWADERPRPRQRELALRYGVSQRLVWNVIHGFNWTHKSGVIVEKGRGK